MGVVELNVLELMKEKGLEESNLADIPAIGEDGASRIVSGNISAIRFSSLAALCDALQCHPGDLFTYVS